MKKETQIARQRIHRRREGQPEHEALSWAVESHDEIGDLAAWLNSARKVFEFTDGLTGSARNTMHTIRVAYLGRTW